MRVTFILVAIFIFGFFLIFKVSTRKKSNFLEKDTHIVEKCILFGKKYRISEKSTDSCEKYGFI